MVRINPKQTELPTLDETIEEHKKVAAFRTEYEKARLRVQIARQIKQAREAAGLTQGQLAQKLGVSQPTIGRLESLKDRRIPSLELVAKVVAVTRAPITLRQSSVDVRFSKRSAALRPRKETE